MRSPFYQANFCAECGNSLEPRFGIKPRYFRPRYFCDDCAARLKQRGFVTPLAGLLIITSLAAFAFNYKSSGPPIHPLNSTTSAPAVSAQDSIVNSRARPQPEAGSRVLCGARTRRGTPCRHLAHPGQRCAQHRGKPSMLDSANTFSSPESRPQGRKD